MLELIQQLTPDEIIQVGEELEKLFILQDRPFGAQQKMLFTREITISGFSFPMIIRGIRSLLTEDLNRISVNTIIGAIRGQLKTQSDSKMREAQNRIRERMDREYEKMRGGK